MDTDEVQGNKFTGFIKPVLDLIDNGVFYRKGFWLLYLLSAIASLLTPIVLLASAISSGFLGYMSFGVVLGLILAWLFVAFSYWLGFQVYWNRMKKIDTLFKEEDDFVAIPLLADYIKTSGEYICIVSVSSVPGLVLFGIVAADAAGNILPIGGTGITFVLTSIFIGILGYVVLLVSKFLAESILALAAIANNTKNLTKSAS